LEIMRVIWFTLIPSPHICGLLNAMSELSHLTVVYEVSSSPKRTWGQYLPKCDNIFLESKQIGRFGAHLDFGLYKFLRCNKADIYIVGTSMWSVNTWIIATFARSHHIPLIYMSEPPYANRLPAFQKNEKICREIFF